MIEKRHNYFYKITNLVNGKYYYGIKSSDSEPQLDTYFGSGKALKLAIKKYGKENFIKEIIADYPTRKEASDHEKLIVTLDLVELDDCYNLKTGGDNEFYHSEATKNLIRLIKTNISVETRNKMSKSAMGKVMSEVTKLKMSKSKFGSKNHQFGKPLSIEHKELISKSRSGIKCSEQQKVKVSILLKGIPKSDETKLKMKNSNAKSISCIINGKFYNTQTEAGIDIGVSDRTIGRRINSSDPKWSDYKKIKIIC